MKKKLSPNQTIIYQGKSGAIEIQIDSKKETLLLTQTEVARIFDVQKAAISKHVHNIFKTKELEKKATVSILETVQDEAGRKIKRKIEYYNLDLILSIGYRVNSKKATKFRQWATSILHKYLLDGYLINKSRIAENYEIFLKAVDQVKSLLPKNSNIDTESILELVKAFADTWLSFDAYDKSELPTSGATKKEVKFTTKELIDSLQEFRKDLISKKIATELFGTERKSEALSSIVGNIFQSFDGKDLYPTVEEKAIHLLYFIVKDHPYVDGNKRSGAFAFVWFLRRAGILDTSRVSPTALTAITLLVAESHPKEKEKMIGFILLLLKKKS